MAAPRMGKDFLKVRWILFGALREKRGGHGVLPLQLIFGRLSFK